MVMLLQTRIHGPWESFVDHKYSYCFSHKTLAGSSNCWWYSWRHKRSVWRM